MGTGKWLSLMVVNVLIPCGFSKCISDAKEECPSAWSTTFNSTTVSYCIPGVGHELEHSSVHAAVFLVFMAKRHSLFPGRVHAGQGVWHQVGISMNIAYLHIH